MKDKIPDEIEETFPADAWSTVEGRASKRADELADKVAEYLARGGKITQIAEGESAIGGEQLT